MFHEMDGGGFMWMSLIFWIIPLAVIIWTVLAIVNKNKIVSRDIQTSETPLDILKKRYAKSEITKDQFEEMKRNIS